MITVTINKKIVPKILKQPGWFYVKTFLHCFPRKRKKKELKRR